MKKIYYLFAFVVVAFTACQKQPSVRPTYTKAMTFTLAQSDYQLLPSSAYPHNTFTFDSLGDANKYIPMILNSKDPQLGDGSTATITFTLTAIAPPKAPKLADSLSDSVSYTLTKSDYLLLPGNKFTDFSAAQILSWVPIKYPNPATNQLALLTFTYYENGVTSTVTQSFLNLNNAWKKLYTLTPAQYTAIGKGGTFNDFSSSDDAQLPSYFNTLLKADAAVTSTAKLGDVQYVSYKYFNSKNYQRVMPLIYDGANWTTKALASTTATLGFVKSGGTWIKNPTVYYTLTKDDATLIGNSTIGTDAQRANLAKYGDFQTSWTAADIQSAMILVLTKHFPTPTLNIPYNITYLAFVNSADVPTTLTFKYNGTTWVKN